VDRLEECNLLPVRQKNDPLNQEVPRPKSLQRLSNNDGALKKEG